MKQSMWDFYNSSSDPMRQASVTEWQSWLAEVEVSSERQRLENDLHSLGKYKHFSARLELYFHHLFKSQGFRIDFHPILGDSTDHPDFLVHNECAPFYLEATIRHDERSFVEQKAFAELLAEKLLCVCSPHHVHVGIYEPCPKITFLPEIKGFLEQQLLLFDEGDEVEKEVVWRKSVHLTSYELLFSLYRGSGACQQLTVSTSWGGFSGISECLYDSVDKKARKYGSLDLPLVIAVWGLSSPAQFAEKKALYGAEAVAWSRDCHGNVVEDSVRPISRPDGIFNIIEDGQLKHRKVSAVVFYRHRLGDTEHKHILRVYHNPYALKPLAHDIFEGVPQLVPVEVDGHGEMQWLKGPPAED